MKTVFYHLILPILMLGLLGGCTGAQVKAPVVQNPALRLQQKADDVSKLLGVPALAGQVTVPSLPGKLFASLQEAVDAAPSGTELVLSGGRFQGPVLIKDKTLIIRGEGARRSFVIGQGTVLTLANANIELRDVGLLANERSAGLPVLSITGGASRIEACIVAGGGGPGILITGRGFTSLLRNHLLSNLGGGLLLQGGRIDSVANVLNLNGVAGVVFGPTSPDAISLFRSQHDTILDNWKGSLCHSMVRTGLTPPQELSRHIYIEYAFLNPDGLDDVFGPGAAKLLSGDSANILVPDDKAAAAIFADPEASDYTPRAPLQTSDKLGLETGALQSADASRTLNTKTNDALATGRLALAYNLGRFLPRDRFLEVAGQVKAALDKALAAPDAGANGVLRHNVLAVAVTAPPSWNLLPALDRMALSFHEQHSVQVVPFDLFGKASQAFRQKMTEVLEAQTGLWPFIPVTGRDLEAKVMLSGDINQAPAVKEDASPISVRESVTNGYIPKLESTVKVYRSRVQQNEKKIKTMKAKLSNPHIFPPGPPSKRKQLLDAQLEAAEKDQAEAQETLDTLQKELDAAPVNYVVELKGEVRQREIRAGSWLSVVTAPSGDILLDRQDKLNHVDRWVELAPLPAFNFPGLQQTPPTLAGDEIFAGRIAVTLLSGVIEHELGRFTELLDKWEAGKANLEEISTLADLLYLHALNFRAATLAQPRKTQVDLALAEGSDGQPVKLKLAYDDARGKAEAGVVMDLQLAPPKASLEEERASLEALFGGYWKLLPRAEKAAVVVLGSPLEEIIYLRGRMEARVQAVTQRQQPEQPAQN
jgi:hypothetical protein